MSYCIDVSYLEKETLAKVVIYNISEEFRSVRVSQFQCIGWLLGVFSLAREKIGNGELVNPEYEMEALFKYSGLNWEDCEHLLSLDTPKGRFDFVWSILDDEAKSVALNMDFRYFDNFWVGFESIQNVFLFDVVEQLSDRVMSLSSAPLGLTS